MDGRLFGRENSDRGENLALGAGRERDRGESRIEGLGRRIWQVESNGRFRE